MAMADGAAREVSDAEAKELAGRWGWALPPDAILQDAKSTLILEGVDFFNASVHLGLIKDSDAENYRASKPAGVRDLDYIAAQNSRVGQNKQRLHAISEGMQYIAELENEHIKPHPDIAQKRELLEALDKFSAVIVLIQDEVPVIVFSNWDQAYQSYKQLAGVNKVKNPIHVNFPNIKAAISSPDQVVSMMAIARASSTKGGKDPAEEELTIIYEHTLKGEDALRKLASIHTLALAKGASDIHIDPDSEGDVRVTHRVWGAIEKMPETLDAAQYHRVKTFLLQKSGASIKFERMREPKDGMYQFHSKDRSVYVRCSYIPLGTGGKSDPVSMCLRIIPMQKGQVSLAKMGVHKATIAALRNALTPDAGMVLVVGPTGSGKSTTVSGAIGEHILLHGMTKTRFSIEDPIERYLPGITQFQVPYHMRGTSAGFTKILRNLLRHDPQLIWVGEIRDADTAEISIQAAATGHSLISTLHADSAVDAVDRVSNMVPADKPFLRKALVKNLSLVVSQRLIRKLCPHCGFAGEPREKDREYVEYLNDTKGLGLKIPASVKYAKEKGCDYCKDGPVPGYAGIIPVNDVLVIDKEAKASIMDITGSAVYEILEKKLKLRMESAIMEAVEEGRAQLSALQY